MAAGSRGDHDHEDDRRDRVNGYAYDHHDRAHALLTIG